MQNYDHKKIEEKWQEKWRKDGLYKTSDAQDKPKYYILDMFPYPSGAGLHVGHPKGYIATDVVARMKMMQGHNVLHPMGWDAFGLPTENFAIKNKIHPRIATEKNIAIFKAQLEKLGFTYDWSKEINTTAPEFYKWTQWVFLQMFKKGLAYESYEPIIWCPSCQTGLAMEDLENGRCERCGSEVERKPMRQWVLKITDYAERLLNDLEKLPQWEESIKEMQKNWIGRSEGATVKFKVKSSPPEADAPRAQKFKVEEELEVFTTRPDTLFGCTYMVVAPEHSLIKNYELRIKNYDEVYKYIVQSKKKSDLERTDLAEEKTGVELKGVKAINPVNNEEIPVFVADYVLAGYGTGAIMAVPAHDERDWEFAKKYDIEIRPVVKADIAKYIIIEKSLPVGAETDLKKFGEIKIEKETADWGKFYNLFVNSKNEKKMIAYLMKNLLKESKDGGAWYADSIGTSNIAVFPGKKMEIYTKEDIEKFEKYGLRLGIPKEQLEVEFQVYSGNGININSGFLNGLKTKDAKEKIIEWLEEKRVGKRAVNYKLRDWVFSRQRYWGEPIPLIFCNECKKLIEKNENVWKLEIGNWKLIVNWKLEIGNLEYTKGELLNPGWVADENLPLTLPEVEHYEPTGTGESPLANMPKWVNTTCPKCGGPAKRETNTMPQWAGSSWYYLRYIDPRNGKALVDKEKEKYWSPVDLYVGGAEHATRHLIYARFWHKFLYDIGAVNYEEPFIRLHHVGLILAEDGRKMSKRWGNVINPDEVVEKYGADAMRVYEMFMGPFSQPCAWSENGLKGARNFLEKVRVLRKRITNYPGRAPRPRAGELRITNNKIERLLHKTIKKVEEDIEDFKFNTAISAMMILVNEMSGEKKISLENYKTLLKILSPFAPFMAEELWEKLGHKESVFKEKWPEYDPELVKDKIINLVVQVNGKLRGAIEVPADISEEEAKKAALESEKIKKWVAGKEIVKVIFVKGKLVNIAVK